MPEPESIVQEHWKTDFLKGRAAPFSEEEGEGYRVLITEKGLVFRMERKNLFAWVLSSPYRYRSFVLTVDIDLDPENEHAAAGVVFRYAGDGSCYYVMVSPEGMFRFDVLFNGTPRTLIPWTSWDAGGREHAVTLTVSAHGTFFTIFINDVWAGEVDDETIPAGFIGIAGQNYHTEDTAEFLFRSVEMESRNLAVEDFYDTRVKGDGIPWINRKNLSRRFFDIGQYSAALIQLRKSYASRRPECDDFLLEARIYNFLNLEEDALRAVENCFPAGARDVDVVLEKAGILYRMNHFLELKEFLSASAPVWEGEPLGWNLRGNAEDALGNFDAACRCYVQAADLDGENGMYRLNASRAYEKTGNSEKAAVLLKEAASIFFNEEDFENLHYALSLLEHLAPEDPALKAFEGKLLFHDGKTGEAFILFQDLRNRGVSDSSVDFLYALICADRGERRKADTIFAQVVEEEPHYYLYWFRYAENLYFLGKDSSFALQKALELKENDPWVQNLAGLIALDSGDTAGALLFFQHAFEADPSLVEVRINYAEALMHAGRTEEALALVEDDNLPETVNARGNLLVKAGRFEEAGRAYYRAQVLDPGERIYRENYADLLIRQDRLLEAEEIIARLLEEKNESSLLQKIAFIAGKKGEVRRAELAFQEALKLSPGDCSVKIDYARFLVQRHKYDAARELLDRIPASDRGEDVESLQREIRSALMDSYECSICHREWWVPKVIPEIGAVKLFGEPHPHSPAGKCPSCGRVYCISCAMDSMKDNHFVCRECGEPLKLSEKYLRYLASEFAKSG